MTIKKASSSETSLTIYQTIRRYIPENSNLHSDRDENPTSKKL
jgi:hypothetical protein